MISVWNIPCIFIGYYAYCFCLVVSVSSHQLSSFLGTSIAFFYSLWLFSPKVNPMIFFANRLFPHLCETSFLFYTIYLPCVSIVMHFITEEAAHHWLALAITLAGQITRCCWEYFVAGVKKVMLPIDFCSKYQLPKPKDITASFAHLLLKFQLQINILGNQGRKILWLQIPYAIWELWLILMLCFSAVFTAALLYF